MKKVPRTPVKDFSFTQEEEEEVKIPAQKVVPSKLDFKPVLKIENEMRENSALKNNSSFKDLLELEPIEEESETEV